MSEKKRFDRELFAAYDRKAREATTAYLTNIGFEVSEHPNRYAQDLIALSPMDNYQFHVECEVKIVWDSEEFPYDTVQLPQRKQKFFDGNTKFFIWNKNLTRAVVFWDSDVSDLTPVEVPNKYVHKGEYFYQIPLEKIEYANSIGHRDK